MTLTALVREAARSARAALVPTALVAVLVAMMCATTLLTVGRAAAAEEQVRDRLEQAGSRRLQVTDVKNKGFLNPSAVTLVAGLDTVERAVGRAVPMDVTATSVGAGGTAVPAWALTGDLADAVDLVAGRWPTAGETLVSTGALARLGLDVPAGSLTSTDGRVTTAVVGTFRARPPFLDLDAGAVTLAGPDAAAHTLDVVVTSAAATQVTQRAVLQVLAREDASDLDVVSPRALADVQAVVLGDLTRYNHSALLVVLATGALLVGVVAFADVLLHRRDIGRRRALGAPRWAVTALVILRTTLAATGGALVGCVTASVIADLRLQYVPSWSFGLATAILAVLTAAIATLPPALVAAAADPVTVLRTP